ncbi:hypothetical protein [Thalassospira mesophila]|uniref:hypothetical protein n=1 Tax=Thalassospira mesophila TaxID=1293891 RepID=UPI000A1FF6B0|nr:hypothetical protein [Thalassospira mesophila]
MKKRKCNDLAHENGPNVDIYGSDVVQSPLQGGFGAKRGIRFSVVAGLTMAAMMVGLAGWQLWQVARVLPDVSDYQAAFRAADGIFLASLRQQIDNAMHKQDWPRAHGLLTQLKRVYPNDVNVLLQDVRVRILMLPEFSAKPDEQAERRAELADALRVIMTLAGKDGAVRQQAERLLAAVMMQARVRFDKGELPARP